MSTIKHLISTLAIYQVRRYNLQGKRHLEVADKYYTYYFSDLGLRHALIDFHSAVKGMPQFL